MVECSFSDTQREAAWNTWYSDHLNDLLSVPEFATAQRFKAVEQSRPKYRAMYTVAAESAFQSPVYADIRGGRFPEEWRSAIIEFHRNLFDGDGPAPEIASDSFLVVVDEPTSSSLDGIELAVWTAVGLEKSVTRRGIAVVDRERGTELAGQGMSGVGVYAPITEQKRKA